jgi:hypothetical protein
VEFDLNLFAYPQMDGVHLISPTTSTSVAQIATTCFVVAVVPGSSLADMPHDRYIRCLK